MEIDREEEEFGYLYTYREERFPPSRPTGLHSLRRYNNGLSSLRSLPFKGRGIRGQGTDRLGQGTRVKPEGERMM